MLRRSLARLLVGSLTVLAACQGGSVEPTARSRADIPTIEGVPPLEDLDPNPDVVEVELTAAPGVAELRPGQLTDVLAFNGSIPGPLLEARVGDRVIVHFTNGLDEPTTVHWHGLRINSAMDGTPRVQSPVPPGGTFDYDFVVPEAGTFWYHPHLNTIEQLARGLYGPIVVTERAPPNFTHQRLWVLSDVRLDPDGSISEFATPDGHDEEDHHDLVHGRQGNVILVNGSAALQTGTIARGAIERWRLLCAAPTRTMFLRVEGATARIVGTDGGLLPKPYIPPDLITLPVGQRYDLEVSVDAPVGALVRLIAEVEVFTDHWTTEPLPLVELTVSDDGPAAATPIYPAVALPPLADDPEPRTLRLNAAFLPDGNYAFTINGLTMDEIPIETFPQGDPVEFTIINEIGPFHPFHVHGQFFQVVSRRGMPANEPGLKDTVLVDDSETVVIQTRFENPGEWMYHCHIPEHSEHGMMAMFDVAPAP
jgi:FtsP/CotA-like multicopper oxidase with cupredoxin domain